MAEKSAKTARVQAVKNENKCSNFGCYAINGKEAYGVKTKDDQQVSTYHFHAPNSLFLPCKSSCMAFENLENSKSY